MGHPNEEIARQMQEAMEEGDLEATAAFIADDVTWHTIGGQTYHGLDQLAEAMAGVGPTISGDVHDVIANDDHLIVLVNATATSNAEEFHYRTAEIMHVADGKITERWSFSDDTQRIIDYFKQYE
ncbi:MAG TPA: nuclear transport factor 2 family protein [Acidimicrobiia bacterium]|jgi:uncharacterized protein (TIGR02246 family)|nr:nuclear transport factor 2 family protein [Acidimicrobiia bacterium]